jgi:hypothetical protein
MSDIIFLQDVRLSFPHIAEPQERVNEKTGAKSVSYNCEFILPKGHPGLAQFMQRYGELALDRAKEHAQAVMNMIQQDRKSRCFGMGEEKVNKKNFQPYDGYAGMAYITAGKDQRPQIIRADGSAVEPGNTMEAQQLARAMYGGCRVNAAIRPWWQNPNPAKQYGHGIRCDLIAVQFFKDDTPLGEGSAPDVTGMFGAVQSAPPMFGAVPAAPTMPGMPSFLMPQ